MSRNMVETNKKFFDNICNCLDKDLVDRVSAGARYIATNEEEKEWLKHVSIKRIHRFSKNSYGLLLLFSGKEYLCLINTNGCSGKLPDVLQEIAPNAGLITALGSEGLLTPKVNRQQQLEICDRVLYEIADDYGGHSWQDIEAYFPHVYCYEICLQEDSVLDVRENKNAFYWILCQVALEFDMGNNPFSDISREAWERIVYEGDFGSTEFKNLLLAYTALSWDITYLYLYQCLEDQFAYKSIATLYRKLDLSVTVQAFNSMLYDELSWQPKDLDGINGILKSYSPEANAIKMLESVSGGGDLAKFVYSTRNRIVHETRETPIPLTADDIWEKTIAGILLLLLGP